MFYLKKSQCYGYIHTINLMSSTGYLVK